MLNPLFLEIANGTLAMSGFALLFVFGRYLLDPKATPRGRNAARAIACFVAGETILRSWIWLWRHQANDGVPNDWMTGYPVVAVGLAVAMIGAFCMMRVFSFSKAPAWIWLVVASATFATMTVVALAR